MMHDSPADLGNFAGLGIDDLIAGLNDDWEVPKEKKKRPSRELKIYTLEIRFPPFAFQRYPRPFAVGLYDGESFHYTWGRSCISEMMFYLGALRRGLIYSHHGGRLHFFFLQKWIQAQKMLIIGNRIVKTHCPSREKEPHELRDSWAIIPVDLKIPFINPAWFEDGKRDRHKGKILDHLKADCVYQHGLVKTFREMFGGDGSILTVGSVAMAEFQKCHPFERLGRRGDKIIRDEYYYGGRTQYFERGILKPSAGHTFKMYDVNSMYPHVMKAFKHPIEGPSAIDNEIRRSTVFLEVEGRQTGKYGAFLAKDEAGGPLRYDVEEGTFYVSIHEFRAAEELGIFKVKKVVETINFMGVANFDEFVDKFAKQRSDYRAAGDQVRADFTKLVHNSAYGKLAQDWQKFRESILVSSEVDLTSQGWRPAMITEVGRRADDQFVIWERTPRDADGNPVVGRFFNIATAASITGAARATLLRFIYQARRPIYTDTDSIICEDLPGVKLDPHELGAWKLEGECVEAAIANRKTYALFGATCWKCGGGRRDPRPRPDGPCDHVFHKSGCVKLATKGVRVDPSLIVKVCLGSAVRWENPVPAMKFGGRPGEARADFTVRTLPGLKMDDDD